MLLSTPAYGQDLIVTVWNCNNFSDDEKIQYVSGVVDTHIALGTSFAKHIAPCLTIWPIYRFRDIVNYWIDNLPIDENLGLIERATVRSRTRVVPLVVEAMDAECKEVKQEFRDAEQ